MPGITYYFNKLTELGGSDVHFASNVAPTIRVNGILHQLPEEPLSEIDIEDMMREILPINEYRRLQKEKNIDFALDYGTPEEGGPWRFRGNAYYQKNGPNIVMRYIRNEVPTLESLGLPADLARLTKHHQGLVLATGQAGCGKTSTLAALINLINEDRPVHIITVEDPIEFVHTPKRALINQRQVGRDVESFALALKGALREDPDVILVGELRDLETISLAITAAETGHLVFGTLHTNSAAKTIDRLIDAFPIDQQAQIRTMLSESLRGVVAQQLIPNIDGTARIPVVEVLVGTTSVANLIREGKTYQITMSMQTGKKDGMRVMDQGILELYQKGIISKDEAMMRSVNKVPYREQPAQDDNKKA
ncbi:MAG: PilT/PilU family type 4a pilus ATPase [bacterium]|nr:PilT/PilU family type 4a pilus ATPase [bacterium]